MGSLFYGLQAASSHEMTWPQAFVGSGASVGQVYVYFGIKYPIIGSVAGHGAAIDI